jgi:hypothetical protein
MATVHGSTTPSRSADYDGVSQSKLLSRMVFRPPGTGLPISKKGGFRGRCGADRAGIGAL